MSSDIESSTAQPAPASVLPKPPLRIVVLFHPQSDAARELAKDMYQRFTFDAGGAAGLRIPVTYGPDLGDGLPPKTIDMDAAVHTLVVVLVDRRMARRVKDSTADAWGNFLVNALADAPQGASTHHVLPVGLDDRAFELDDRLDKSSFVRLDIIPAEDREQRADELAFQIAVRALHFLQRNTLPANLSADTHPAAPLEMFISHAKVDLPSLTAPEEERRSDPVMALLSQLAQGPVDGWYDAKKIPPGGRFDKEIEAGVLASSVVVSVLTDRYTTREWCRREVLESKRTGRPMIVVDALEQGEIRNFPYLGNVPTIRWNDDGANARTVIGMAIREALRYQHNLAALDPWKQPEDVVLGTSPELLTVGRLPHPLKRVVYPDPPLGGEELDVIKLVADGTPFVTPLSELAARPKPANFDLVGLSLSGSTDIRRHGLDSEHLGTLSDDLCLYLLFAGLQLAYGGQINHDGDKQDDENFTVRLFGLVRSFSPLAKDLGGTLAPVLNYVGWPIYQGFDDDDYDLYGRQAELHEIDPPDPLGIDKERLGLDERGWCPPQTPEQRFAWGRGMTAMRERMTQDIDARVAIGGKLDRYVGIYPGVLEEAMLMLRSHKPLYLIGAFGGASRLVADLLERVPRSDFTTTALEKLFPDTYKATIALYQDADVDFSTPEQIVAELNEIATSGLASALANGLDEMENRTLIHTTDPRTMIELILLGMSRLKTAPE